MQADGRPAKRSRHSHLVGIRYVTDSALASVLQCLRSDGSLSSSVSGISRRNLKKHSEAFVEQPTVYGSAMQKIKLPLADGGTWDWDVLHPGAYLNLCAQTKSFAQLLGVRLQECPSTLGKPWHLLYYADECTAGNMLAIDQSRKSWCIYYSWKELGHEALAHDSAWLVGGIIRHNIVKKIAGGFGTVFKHHLQHFFGNEFDLRLGVTVHAAGHGILILFSTLGLVLADESGHKSMWDFKGAGGWRCCGLCSNVVNERYLPIVDGSSLVSHTCTDHSKFRFATNESTWAAVDNVARATTKKERIELEKMFGIVHNPNGVLLCRGLRAIARPTDVIVYDIMHCILTNGTLALELQLFILRARSLGFLSFEVVANFMGHWHWPKHVGAPKTLWSQRHDDSSNEFFKGGASELLSYYPAFRELVKQSAFTSAMASQVKSLFALCHVLDGWAVIQRGQVPARWAESIAYWYQCFQEAWPDVTPKPKHHFCMHLPRHLARHKCLPALFVNERRHKTYKNYAKEITASTGFERSVTISMVNDHLRNMREGETLRTGIYHRNPRSADAAWCSECGFHSAEIALSGSCHGVETSVGDMVFLRMEGGITAAEVMLHVLPSELGFQVVVRLHVFAEGLWVPRGGLALVPIDCIIGPAIWKAAKGGRQLIELPCVEY